MSDDTQRLQAELQLYIEEANTQLRNHYEERIANLKKSHEDSRQRHEEQSQQAHLLIRQCQLTNLELKEQLNEVLATNQRLSVQLEQSQLMYRQLLDVVRSIAENSSKDFPVHPQDS